MSSEFRVQSSEFIAYGDTLIIHYPFSIIHCHFPLSIAIIHYPFSIIHYKR